MAKPTEEERLAMTAYLLQNNPDNAIIVDSENPHVLNSVAVGAITCDFCSKKNDEAKVYDAEPFSQSAMANWDSVYDDKWSACTECVPLIEAKDIEGLINRSLKNAWAKTPKIVQQHPEAEKFQAMLRNDIARVHYGFWEHKK